MKNPIDPNENNARLIVKKLRVIWSRASASQIRRILTDSEEGGANVLNVVDSVVNKCDIFAAVGKLARLWRRHITKG